MSLTAIRLTKVNAETALRWFQAQFQEKIVGPIEVQFPGFSLPREVQDVLNGLEDLSRLIGGMPGGQMSPQSFLETIVVGSPALIPLFKRAILAYRRHRAAETERLTEKTFHLQLTESLEEERKVLDAIADALLQISHVALPKLKDFLPIQYIEAAATQTQFQPRQFDEKFHILQAPQLFLPDMAYLRAKCEDRGMPLAIAFVDIDDFKSMNTRHSEVKVDRNLLPRFMQAIEAHVYHHGYAYRQGGDEYLILLPSLSSALSIGVLDELRVKLASLSYPDITEKTTVSIGLCIADSECPLTDRELLDRANRAKQFAKQNGKNCIATYKGPRFIPEELHVVTTKGS